MCSRFLLAVAVLLATAIAAVGQNSVEYGRLPIVPPKVSNPASKLASRVGDQSSGHKTTNVVDVPSQDSKATAQDKNTGAVLSDNSNPEARSHLHFVQRRALRV